MDESDYRKKLEAMGEQAVRDAIRTRRFNPRHAAIAQGWLDDLERSRSEASRSRSEASQAEQAQIATVLAQTAKTSNKVAIAMIIITAIGIVAGIVVALFRH